MFGFGIFGHARQKTRRFLAFAGIALLFCFQLFSLAYIAIEADHDCCGEDCPICLDIRHCLANLQLTGSGLEDASVGDELPPADTYCPPSSVPALVSATPVSLKVRLNE